MTDRTPAGGVLVDVDFVLAAGIDAGRCDLRLVVDLEDEIGGRRAQGREHLVPAFVAAGFKTLRSQAREAPQPARGDLLNQRRAPSSTSALAIPRTPR